MKKVLFLAIFSLTLVFSPVSFIRAQTVSETTTIAELQEIVNSLLAQVAILMQQLAVIQANEASQDNQIASIQTEPILGASEIVEPEPIPELTASINFDLPQSFPVDAVVREGNGEVKNKPIKYSVNGNFEKALIIIKNDSRNTTVTQQWVEGDDDVESWLPGAVYSWTLTAHRGEEVKTFTGSFTTPSK